MPSRAPADQVGSRVETIGVVDSNPVVSAALSAIYTSHSHFGVPQACSLGEAVCGPELAQQLTKTIAISLWAEVQVWTSIDLRLIPVLPLPLTPRDNSLFPSRFLRVRACSRMRSGG